MNPGASSSPASSKALDIQPAPPRSGREDYRQVYARSIQEPGRFWEEVGRQIAWYSPWTRVLDADNAPFFKWFVGGKTNVVLNAIDRHLDSGRAGQPAIYWEGEPGERLTLTYGDLDREVCKFANVLKSLDVRKSDRVVVYMPRIPEQAVAMLAVAKIGAVHTVVYAGLSVEALRSRISDSGAKVLITADGGYLGGKTIPLKDIADAAVGRSQCIERVVVVRRTNSPIAWDANRDAWWHDLMSSNVAATVCPTEPMDAEDPFFIIYTSGSTGPPKGVVHAVGGFCADVYASLGLVLDLRQGDVLFCTSDAGWLVGHTITLYGALLHGIATVIYEGAPVYPKQDRWWEIIERYKATVFYTSPTGIRGLMRFGDEWPRAHDLSSLRLLSVAGEPLNPKAWSWYHETIGRNELPVIDSWWQTETSRPIISNLPGLPIKPGSCGVPMPGIGIEVVDEKGQPVPPNTEGLLLLTKPWPGMVRTIYGDPKRFVDQYWRRFGGKYLTGDGARIDEDGYVWVTGRVDDVIKVSGYRLGTAEIEGALLSHAAVAEAAVIGLPDEVRGNCIRAFVVLVQEREASDSLTEEFRQHVAKQVGPIARPESVTIVAKLPKTRSGKIMRRVLRAEALGEALGDLSTLEE
jgi:acetyl-CoA synthetase